MKAELNLPDCVVPEAKRCRLSLAEYDKWVNDNLRTLRDPQRRKRIRAQLSRQPVAARFHID